MSANHNRYILQYLQIQQQLPLNTAVVAGDQRWERCLLSLLLDYPPEAIERQLWDTKCWTRRFFEENKMGTCKLLMSVTTYHQFLPYWPFSEYTQRVGGFLLFFPRHAAKCCLSSPSPSAVFFPQQVTSQTTWRLSPSSPGTSNFSFQLFSRKCPWVKYPQDPHF